MREKLQLVGVEMAPDFPSELALSLLTYFILVM